MIVVREEGNNQWYLTEITPRSRELDAQDIDPNMPREVYGSYQGWPLTIASLTTMCQCPSRG